jgi:uncharacterized GH25 family protein
MQRILFSTFLAAGLLASAAQAHDLWIQPSATVLSGDEARVTFDAAAGNDKFYYNHRPLPTRNLRITGPDGKPVEALNVHTGDVRSSFDLRLKTDGTYRVALVNGGVLARWKENGANKRWMGAASELAKNVPANAQDLSITERAGRVETFVTKGKPSKVEAVGEGMELIADPHPNDLYAGETTRFTLLVDGKPAPGLDIKIATDGSRYRDTPEDISAKTDAEGNFSIKWPRPGLFWIHAETSDGKTTVAAAKQRGLSYAGTFEVLPD